MKRKEKMWGTWHIISPLSEKVGGGRPRFPPPNCAHERNKSQCNAKHTSKTRKEHHNQGRI